jgi:hypothetical protein
MKKSRLLAAALSIALTVLFLTGCPADNPDSGNGDFNPPPTDSNPTQTTDPNGLTQQTRVVLVELFMANW